MENRETSGAQTTVHVQRAKDGDETSLAWLAQRFGPLLLAQAKHRLRGPLQGVVHPEDLVHDVWAVTLRTLPSLRAEHGRETPVLLKFLSTTLLYRSNELLRKHVRQRARSAADSEGRSGLSQLPADSAGVVTRAIDAEDQRLLTRAIDALPDLDRQVIVLRGIEQHSNQKVAELLGQSPNAVSLRYNRVLKALRDRFSKSVFTELDEDPESKDS